MLYGNAFRFEFLHYRNHLAAAADHGDVARLGRKSPPQYTQVVAMAACDDDDETGCVHRKLRKDLFVFARQHLAGIGEALAVGERFAIVDDHGVESGQRRRRRKTFRDVPRPEDERARLWTHRLDEHLQFAAADQTVVARGVLVEREVEPLGLPGADHLARGGVHLRLDAAAADGADHGPVAAHQQLRGLVTRNGATDFNDRSQRTTLAGPPQAHQFLVNVHPAEL